MGHVVSSQAYVDDQNENIQSKASEVNVADEPMNVACEWTWKEHNGGKAERS